MYIFVLHYPHMVGKKDRKLTEKFGNYLKKAREKTGLSQAEVAKGTKMHKNYYAKIERGEVNTSYLKIYKIAKVLKVKASEIFPF